MPSKTARRRRKRSSGAEPARSCGAARPCRIHRTDRARSAVSKHGRLLPSRFRAVPTVWPSLFSRTDGRASAAARFARCPSTTDCGPKAKPKSTSSRGGWRLARSAIASWSGKGKNRSPASRKRHELPAIGFWKSGAGRTSCLHLLTGHHRDDQIETHLIATRPAERPGWPRRHVSDSRDRQLPHPASAARDPQGAPARDTRRRGPALYHRSEQFNSAYARARLRDRARYRPRRFRAEFISSARRAARGPITSSAAMSCWRGRSLCTRRDSLCLIRRCCSPHLEISRKEHCRRWCSPSATALSTPPPSRRSVAAGIGRRSRWRACPRRIPVCRLARPRSGSARACRRSRRGTDRARDLILMGRTVHDVARLRRGAAYRQISRAGWGCRALSAAAICSE